MAGPGGIISFSGDRKGKSPSWTGCAVLHSFCLFCAAGFCLLGGRSTVATSFWLGRRHLYGQRLGREGSLFVLSGFLISFHIMRLGERINGPWPWRSYLAKRILRIVPAYYVTLRAKTTYLKTQV